MVQKRFIQILLIAAVTALAHKRAHAQEDGNHYYLHGALSNAYYEEKAHALRADELEREVIRKRDDYETRRREVDRQIAAHKYQIEELKAKQAAAQQELDTINVDLKHVRDQVASYQEEHKRVDDETHEMMSRLKAQQDELQAAQKQMDQELANLTEARKSAEREIYEKSMGLERMKADLARTQTKIAAAESKRAALEAEEMKTRTDWMQAKMQLAEIQQQNDLANSQLEETKERWNVAQKELSETKGNLARAQKNRDAVVSKVKEDVARYEREILAANRAKIAGEAEQIRLASEVDKMHDYASRIRETRDQAVEQENDVNGLVLRTKVAVESARTELTSDVEASDRRSLLNEKENSRRRGLASAAQAAEMLNGTRIWTTKEKCKAYLSPSSSAKAVGFFDSGRKLMGKDRGDSWIEISDGGGKKVFVEAKCGEYSE